MQDDLIPRKKFQFYNKLVIASNAYLIRMSVF